MFPPTRTGARRRAAAVALVTVPLVAALLPFGLPPFTSGLAAALAPLTALLALAAGWTARRLARGEPPRVRRALATISAGTVALALVPGVASLLAARNGVRDVDALSLPAVPAPGAARPALRLADVLRGPPGADGVEARAVSMRSADGSPLALRLYRDSAGAPAPRPVVVVVYAGAWRSGDATQAERVSRHLARLGHVVLAADYRHAPRHRHPAQVDDVRGALALLRDSAAAWGADTGRVALWGRSSGAHLAMLAAWGEGAEAPPLSVRGVVAFYGPYDLAAGYADPPRPDPIDVRAVLRGYVGGPPEAMPDRYRAASPSSRVRGGLPPTLLVYAGRDHLVRPRFGREAAAALRAAGSPVVHVELPWAEHGFDLAPLGADGAAALWVAERFLARVIP